MWDKKWKWNFLQRTSVKVKLAQHVIIAREKMFWSQVSWDGKVFHTENMLNHNSCKVLIFKSYNVQSWYCSQIIMFKMFTTDNVHNSYCSQVQMFTSHNFQKSKCSQFIMFKIGNVHRLNSSKFWACWLQTGTSRCYFRISEIFNRILIWHWLRLVHYLGRG